MASPKEPDHIIEIFATTAIPHPLTLTEGTTSSSTETDDKNFTTEVNSGDTVQWKISSDSSNNITAITAVSVTRPYFSQLPSSANDWIGRVGTGNGSNASESYSISYNVSGAGGQTQDPIIKMKN